jgi:hypothetical protein
MDAPGSDFMTAYADALYEAWATGWRRADGSLADEFVMHTWSRPEPDGYMSVRSLCGLDVTVPDDLDAFLDEDPDGDLIWEEAG